MNKPKRARLTPNEKIAEADRRASFWLAEANEASESGRPDKERECLRKAQFWLDKLNRLEGYS